VQLAPVDELFQEPRCGQGLELALVLVVHDRLDERDEIGLELAQAVAEHCAAVGAVAATPPEVERGGADLHRPILR